MNLNYRLIIALSLLGFIMAVASAYFLPVNAEPIGWAIIFIISGYFIGRYADDEYFLHGLLLGLLNAVWYMVVDVLLYKHFYVNRRSQVDGMMDLGIISSIQMTMLILYPVVGLICGSIIGFIAFLFSKIKSVRAN